jgi:hypothetical protein
MVYPQVGFLRAVGLSPPRSTATLAAGAALAVEEPVP